MLSFNFARCVHCTTYVDHRVNFYSTFGPIALTPYFLQTQRLFCQNLGAVSEG